MSPRTASNLTKLARVKEERPDEAHGYELWQLVKDSTQPIRRRRALIKVTPQKATPFHLMGGAELSSPPKPALINHPSSPSLDQAIITKPRTPTPSQIGDGFQSILSRNQCRKIERGLREAEAVLDLHGLNAEEARHQVFHFIRTQSDRGKRLISIITGKGRGVLQTALLHWLNEAPCRQRILARQTAPRQFGGEGAVFLYLRRQPLKTE